MIHLSGAINSGASTRARRVQRSLDCYRNWKSIVAKNLVSKKLVTPPATPPVQTQEWGVYIFSFCLCVQEIFLSQITKPLL